MMRGEGDKKRNLQQDPGGKGRSSIICIIIYFKRNLDGDLENLSTE